MIFFLHIHNHWYYLFYYYFFENFNHLHFCNNYFSSILCHLVRNDIFYYFLKKSSNLVTNFYYVIYIVYIYSWKNKLIKFSPILVMQLTKTRLFWVFNLTMKWTPPPPGEFASMFPIIIIIWGGGGGSF